MKDITSSEIIEKINNNESFIVKFYATWCGPCKSLTEEFNKIESKVPVYEFDVESDVEFSKSMLVRSVPVLKFFKNGKNTHTNVGLISGNQISLMTEQHILNEAS
jgi:thioredoxin-like negative regulator of GroEL